MTSSEVVDIYGVKQIHELNQLNKLNGKEELLIDNGEVTLRVTVDTMLGYIRDQINGSTGGGSSSLGTTIILLMKENQIFQRNLERKGITISE